MKIIRLYTLFVCAIALSQTTVTMLGPDGANHTYTLKDHPRIILDGPSGSITTFIKDPGNNTNCSGHSCNAAYASAQAQSLRDFAQNRQGSKSFGANGMLVGTYALMYFMCNACTAWDGATWQSKALNELRNFDTANWWWPQLGGGINPTIGADINSDYHGEDGLLWGMAYSIMRSQLTTGERQKFADWWLTGLPQRGVPGSGFCKRTLERVGGTISATNSAGTWTLTRTDSTTWDSNVTTVGNWIYIGNWAQASIDPWCKVATVDSNTITANNCSITDTGTITTGFYGKYNPWTPGGNYCGTAFYDGPDSPTGTPPMTVAVSQVDTVIPKLQGTLSALSYPVQIGGVSTTITVNKTYDTGCPDGVGAPSSCTALPLGFGYPTADAPWYAYWGGNVYLSEVMEVTHINGTTWTVTRGKWGHTYDWVNNQPIMVTQNVYFRGSGAPPQHLGYADTPGQSSWDNNDPIGDLDNRANTRLAGLLAITLALADDDSRAQTVLAMYNDWWVDKNYKWAKELFTVYNTSAIEYGLGRTADYIGWMSWIITNGISSPTVDYLSGAYQKELMGRWWIYNAAPWGGNYTPTWGVCNFGQCIRGMDIDNRTTYQFFNAWSLYPNTDEAKQSYDWLVKNGYYTKYLSGGYITANDATATENFTPVKALLSGFPTSWSQSDYTQLPTSKIWKSGDNGTGRGMHFFNSKSSWASTATQLWGLFPDQKGDKFYTDHMVPSTYFIGKNGWLVWGAWGGRNSHTIYATQQNGVDFGATEILASWPTAGAGTGLTGYDNMIIRQPTTGSTGTDFMYVQVDSKMLFTFNLNNLYGNPHGVTRYYQHFAHLKTGKEFIVVYYDVGKSATTKVRAKVHYDNNNLSECDPYAQDSPSCTIKNAEGPTTIDTTNQVVDSRNAAGSKVLTKWLVPTGSSPMVYDYSVVQDYSNTLLFYLGYSCSSGDPCKVRLNDGTTYTYTAQSTITSAVCSLTGNAPCFMRVWIDPADGGIKANYDSTFVSAPSVTGSVTVIGTGTDFPANTIHLLEARVSGDGVTSTADPSLNCPGDSYYTIYTNSHIRDVGQCFSSNDPLISTMRTFSIEVPSATNAEFVLVHRPTSTIGETADAVTQITGPTSHVVVQIDGSDPAIVAFPKSGTTVTNLSFTSTTSTSARLMIGGVQPGTYTITSGGTAVGSYTVPSGDNALYMANVPAGNISMSSGGGGGSSSIVVQGQASAKGSIK